MTIQQNNKKKIRNRNSSQEKKQKIFHTAVELFQQNGYDSVTIQDISDATGMTVGSIYNFFGSKSGILSSFSEILRETTQSILTSSKDNLKTPRQTILRYLKAQSCEFENLGFELTQKFYLTTQINPIPGIYTGNNELLASYNNDLYQYLIQAREYGSLTSDSSPEEIASKILVIGNGLVSTWSIYHGSFSLSEVTEEFISNYLDSIAL